MPTINFSEIAAGLRPKRIVVNQSSESKGDYSSVESAINNEPDAFEFVLINSGSVYEPSADILELRENQKLTGFGNPTIKGTTLQLLGDNCQVSDLTVTGSKSSNIENTTLLLGGSESSLENVTIENRRVESNGDFNRINKCKITGDITDEYDTTQDKDVYYAEVQVIGKELSKTGEIVTHTFAQKGEYDVSLEIDNGDTATGVVRVGGTTDSTVTASGDADFTISPLNPSAGEQVTFDGSSSTNAGSYNWTHESVGDYQFISENYVEGEILSPTDDYNQTNDAP